MMVRYVTRSAVPAGCLYLPHSWCIQLAHPLAAIILPGPYLHHKRFWSQKALPPMKRKSYCYCQVQRSVTLVPHLHKERMRTLRSKFILNSSVIWQAEHEKTTSQKNKWRFPEILSIVWVQKPELNELLKSDISQLRSGPSLITVEAEELLPTRPTLHQSQETSQSDAHWTGRWKP